MKFEKIHNKGQAQLFKEPVLEKLTKVHPLVIWGIYLPVVIGLPIYVANKFDFSGGKIALLFFLGMLAWTLFEYIMHRWVFHIIAESERAQKIIYIMHGNHHHYPRDRERLFMPPVPSLILASAIFGLLYLAMRENAFAFSWFHFRLFNVWFYALCHSCLEPTIQMDEAVMEKPPPASL